MNYSDFLQLQKNIFRNYGIYNYSLSKTNILLESEINRNILNIIPHKISSDKQLSVAITCGAPAIILDNEEVFEFKKFGKIIGQLLKVKNRFLKYTEIKELLFSSEESKHESLLKDSSEALWMRLDFVKDRKNQLFNVVDVNLLPGGFYFTEVLHNEFKNIFPKYKNYNHYKVNSFINHLTKQTPFFSYSCYKEIKVVSLSNHGLHYEYLNLAKLLNEKLDIPVTHENDILKLSPKDKFIIRGFRLRHLNKNEREHIYMLVQAGVKFIEPFTLWQEDHLWFYLIRKYFKEFSKLVPENDLLWLIDRMPYTYLADNGNEELTAISPEGVHYPIDEEFIKGKLVKGGDSSGGRKIIIVKKGCGVRTREKAIQLLRNNSQTPYVVQEMVLPTKYKAFGISPNASFEEIQQPIKYSTFYVDGLFIGGIAVIAPSLKVGGGLKSTNIPIFWKK